MAGCDEPVKARGWCMAHYLRDRRYGDPLGRPAPRRRDLAGQVFGLLTVLEHAGGRYWRCRCQCGAVVDVASSSLLSGGTSSCGSTKHRRRAWVQYGPMHERLRADRGDPRAFPCVDCGRPARQWSYNHDDPAAKRQPGGAWYSRDPGRYSPRCVSCHKRFDLAVLAGRRLGVPPEAPVQPALW